MPESSPAAHAAPTMGAGIHVPDHAAWPVAVPYYGILAVAMAVAFLLSLQKSPSKGPRVPILNPKKAFEFSESRARSVFLRASRRMLETWFREHPDEPARVIGDAGEVTVLPPRLANEIRNDPRLSFAGWIRRNFHAHIPGFDAFREGGRDSRIVQDVIIKDLTKSLNKVTEPLSQETALAVDEVYPAYSDGEWHTTVSLRETLLRLVARVSSRVFLGEELCRNEDWLRVARDYTVDSYRAAEELRLWPAAVRPLVHWFLPLCRRARGEVRDARRIIGEVLEKRRAQRQNGEKVEYEDTIEWFEREAKGRDYDPAVAQLILSFAAIHTTTDLITQVMTDLVRNPDIIDELRQEMVTVLRDGGWKKASLYNMKLLDSVIKESLRIKPQGIVSMRRLVTENVELSDGTFIPRGSTIAVSAEGMWDTGVYERPREWDGRRFLRMRQTAGGEHAAQLVSTGPDHLGFGHGRHACPGRFFASNEAKVILVHLLLKYDWRLPRGAPEPRVRNYAFTLRPDPLTKLEYRHRTPEMEL